MMATACPRIRIQTQTRFHYAVFSFSQHKLLLLRRALTTLMAHEKPKRPTCPSCSRPARTCLCSRIPTPAIDNSVGVTILQHALECKHPLNSTRIARLGLRNLSLATVSDVNFEARFIIRLMKPDSESGFGRKGSGASICRQASEIGETQKPMAESIDATGNLEPQNITLIGSAEKCSLESSLTRKEGVNYVVDLNLSVRDGVKVNEKAEICPLHSNVVCTRTRGVYEYNGGSAITAIIGKNGVISSLSHIWMPLTQPQKPSFDSILACPEACEALSSGFWVKKLKRRQFDEECEFELKVPSGTVLLFPSDKAVDINDLNATGFKVKNLIVLDGTWAKARRVYNENPWLNILPHLKLEVNEMSLYSEVRQQPKAGYLSTIESIVHVSKAVGENNHEGLDNLLDAFESMVGDQKRCKEERLSKLDPF